MLSDFTIRRYTEDDLTAVCELFYETIHSVNAKDYSPRQLFAWARDKNSLRARREDLLQQKTFVAEAGGKTVGFGSIDKNGCLDLLYVHKDFQRSGIATALCDVLERGFSELKTYASVTAKPFFERRGYTVIKRQEVERLGVRLVNYEMRKIVSLRA